MHARHSARDPLASVLYEALGAVIAPDHLDDVIDEALRLAELTAIPDAPLAMRPFIEGALFTALTRKLDVSSAIEVLAQVRSALELAFLSAVRPVSDMVASIPRGEPSLVVATSASLIVFLLAEVVGEHVAVVPVGTLHELREELRRRRGSTLHVVIDRKHPAIDLTACALLREELGAESAVVWWGASPAERKLVPNLLAGGPHAILCEDLRLVDLGQLCTRLVSGPCEPEV